MNLLLYCAQYKGRIIGALLGFISAILMLTIGFFPTLLIIALMSSGAFLGYAIDNKEVFKEKILFIKSIFISRKDEYDK